MDFPKHSKWLNNNKGEVSEVGGSERLTTKYGRLNVKGFLTDLSKLSCNYDRRVVGKKYSPAKTGQEGGA